MGELQIVAGDFGIGAGRYGEGAFRLPGKVRLSVGLVATIEANDALIRKHWGDKLLEGAGRSALLVPIGVAAGAVLAPFAVAVVPLAVSCAAIGVGLSFMGGSTKTKALVQVFFSDGRGFVAICEKDLVAAIESGREIALRFAEEKARAERKAGSRIAMTEALVPPEPARPSDEPGPSLLATAGRNATDIAQTVSETTGKALTSAAGAVAAKGEALGHAVSSAAAAAQALGGAAADAAGTAVLSAWSRVRRPKNPPST